MELLPEGQRNTAAEVLWEDQQKINKFSTLINKKDEQLEILEKLKTEKEYLDDLALEIELLDEDEKIQYKIGEVFVFLKVEKAVEKIEAENEKLSSQIDEIYETISTYDESLADLKKQLYAKFGNNINLER
ncbi:Prefoldin beta-like protein [Scheffersomyces xylosifermentans]|uniref:Prefoldin beta-like protein n=1 Tax=Scheffersomyces xylosifermentans TaxID=1304137 RepID=UPI00315D0E86